MLRTNPTVKNQFEFVCIEDLVWSNHPLRRIQKHIDFSFILELVRPYYYGSAIKMYCLISEANTVHPSVSFGASRFAACRR